MTLRDALYNFVDRMMKGAIIVSPRFTDYRINKIEDYGSDAGIDAELREAVREEIKEQTTGSRKSREVKETEETIESWKSGNVGKIQQMSNTHFGNLKHFARDPFGFFITIFTKKVVRLLTIVGMVLLFFEIVKFVIDELMKPGRALDRRFKRDTQREIFLFWTQQEQEKLKRGFIDIRVTTMPGLRGGMNQVSGNLFTHQAVSGTIGPGSEYYKSIDWSGLPPRTNSSTTVRGNPKWKGRFR